MMVFTHYIFLRWSKVWIRSTMNNTFKYVNLSGNHATKMKTGSLHDALYKRNTVVAHFATIRNVDGARLHSTQFYLTNYV